MVTGGIVEGHPCATMLKHTLGPASHSVTDMLQPDVILAYNIVAHSPATDAIVYNAACAPIEGCVAPSPNTVMLATADLAFGSAVPIGVPPETPMALDLDGSRLVVSYRVGVNEIVVSRFDASTGALNVGEVVVPIKALSSGDAEADTVSVLRTVGKEDYLIAYTVNGALGYEGHLVRLTLARE